VRSVLQAWSGLCKVESLNLKGKQEHDSQVGKTYSGRVIQADCWGKIWARTDKISSKTSKKEATTAEAQEG